MSYTRILSYEAVDMFFVYALLDLRKPGRFATPYLTYLYQPFYIGKGSNDRVRQHEIETLQIANRGGSRTHKQNTVLKMLSMFNELPAITFLCDSEQAAFDIEAELTHLFELRAHGGILTNVDYGGKGGNIRSAETRKRMSAGKQGCVFSPQHLANLAAANKIIGRTVHLGAKRKQSTKTAISKSRFGAASKVAKIWKFTDPAGHVIAYKGGMRTMVELFDLSETRLIRFIGAGVIPQPTHSGHLKPPVHNCTGWSVEKITDESSITFSLAYI